MRRSAGILTVVVATILLLAGGSSAAPGDLILVSATEGGVKSNGASYEVAISADGTRVAFSTDATNLDPRDTDGVQDVYVKDLVTGDLILASTSAAGVKGNGISLVPSLSADGTKVAFDSRSTNLTPEAVGGVFVKDLVTGEIVLASTSDAGVPGGGTSPSLSADGTRVAFQGGGLDPADTDDVVDVYVKDLTTGNLIFASTSDEGMNGDGGFFGSVRPFLSADGTRVGFLSDEVDLDPADGDGIGDSYVKDLTTGDLILVSTSDAGVKGDDFSGRPSLSADGRKALFASSAGNLDPQKTTRGGASIYLKDLATGDVTLVSVTETGKVLAGTGSEPFLAADGSRFAFDYRGTVADPGDTDQITDVYVKDLVTGDLILASTSAAGVKGNGDSYPAVISGDGGRAAFRSEATNLDPADADSLRDVYAKEPGGAMPPPESFADLSVTKTDSPDPVLAGETLTYQIAVSNAGPSGATGVLVLDELPQEVAFVSATASQGSGCSASDGRVACTLGSLTVGGSAAVTIKVRPMEAPRFITNRATVQANEPDADTFDNTSEAQTSVDPAADLALSKSDSPDPVRARDQLTYKLVITNNGPSTAGTVTLVDSLPREVQLVSATASVESATGLAGGCNATRGTVTVTCTFFGLAPGDSGIATLVVTAKRTGTITNTASVTSDVADLVSGNNTATETTTVVR
jgi:uncharacterized repeat protein (TIGR01451 family)